ncbi:MAG: RNA pseudouridine synthase [Clostridia bacterium]|nr:RNA pseudouridine synthase [Clostridia bacterium]
MEIVYKSRNAVVINKPEGMPSQHDKTLSDDAISALSRTLSDMGERAEVYPVHRLDRVVGGLMVLARNKKSAAALSALVGSEGVGKEYLAVCDGAVNEPCEMRDHLSKVANQNVSRVSRFATRDTKEAVMYCEPLALVNTEKGEKTLLKITLKTGRFHQIRAQLSSRGLSITGDKKYGSRDFGTRNIALYSCRISFTLDSEKIEASSLPDIEKYPWCLFSKDKYKI